MDLGLTGHTIWKANLPFSSWLQKSAGFWAGRGWVNLTGSRAMVTAGEKMETLSDNQEMEFDQPLEWFGKWILLEALQIRTCSIYTLISPSWELEQETRQNPEWFLTYNCWVLTRMLLSDTLSGRILGNKKTQLPELGRVEKGKWDLDCEMV